jgi:large subunit ribosomal protein L30
MLLTVQQTGSPIRCNDRWKTVEKTLRGLKLNRIGRTSQLPDTPEVRGMIDRVKHIVDVIYWQIDIRHFAEEIRREYKDVVTSRIVRG